MENLVLNIFVAFVSILPVIIVLWVYKSANPSHVKLLWLGVAFIVWGTLFFAQFSSGLSAMLASVANNSNEQELKETVVQSMRVWVFVFPAVTLAVGANLLTQYILTNENT